MKITPNLKVEIPEPADAANTPHYLDSGFTAFDSAIATNTTAIATNTTTIATNTTTIANNTTAIANHIASPVHTANLAHSRSGTRHLLTGVLPSTGIVTCTFKPTASFVEGDSFSINGSVYSASDILGQPVSGFKAGVPVAATIDINSKTMTIGGGGGSGMGKMVQQLKLPFSNLYDSTGTTGHEWVAEDEFFDTAVNPYYRSSFYDEKTDTVYSLGTENINSVTYNVVTKQIYKTRQKTRYIFSQYNYNSAQMAGICVYDGGVYAIEWRKGAKTLAIIKFNLSSSTTTDVRVIPNSKDATYDMYGFSLYMFSDHEFFALISFRPRNSSSANVEYLYYDFLQNQSRGQYIDSFATSSMFMQKIENAAGDKIRMFLPAASPKCYDMYMSTIVNGSNQKTVVNLPSDFYKLMTQNTDNQNIAHAHIGNKIVYASMGLVLGGKHTGEIDAINLTIDPTKYPEIPYGKYPNDIGQAILLKTNDSIAYFGRRTVSNVQYNTLISLELIPMPPQNRPLVMKIFKGDKYNAPSTIKNIEVQALSNISQPAFTITNMQQTATRDYEIHTGQYDSKDVQVDILIEKS